MSDDCIQQLTQNQYDYLWNSGHFFAQLGQWQNCTSASINASYFLANFVNNKTKAPANMVMGICAPASCDPQFVQDIVNIGLQPYQEMIVASLGMPLAVGQVDVNPQTYVYTQSGWFYVTVISLILLVLTALYATFRKKRPGNKVDTILECFSITQSMKIFTYKVNYLNIFNGIKTICMLWVVLGHFFSIRLKKDVNIAGLPSQVQKFFFLFITAAFLAVDVFFWIGGFLVAYSFMRQKSKTLLKYPMAVVHRILRFWPSYAAAILIYYSVYIHTNSGPIWQDNMTLGQIPYCQGAWKTLLFVDNLVDNGQKMCMAWGWYLQNDMQIFVFSLVFIILYKVNKTAGYISLALVMIGGVALNIYEVINHEIKQVTHLIDFIKWGEYFTNIYIKPWIRCPPYIFGLICGLLHMQYLQCRKKHQENPQGKYGRNFFIKLRIQLQQKRWLVWLFQTLGVALMLTTVILPRDLQNGNTWQYWGHALYLSLQKITFTLGIYLLIIPTLLEVSNISFFLLDTKFFNITGKISFWVYLCHLMVVEYYTYNEKVDFYYTPQDLLPMYCGIALISMIYGFFGTLFIEIPFSKLQKILLTAMMGKGKREPRPPKNPESILQGKDTIASQTKVNTTANQSLNQSLISKQGSLVASNEKQEK